MSLGVITVGVDLSAEPTKTVAAVVRWDDTGAVLTDLRTSATDKVIVALASGASKVGIDCPLGWPRAFTDFIVRHERGEIRVGEGEDIAARRALAYRRTDLAVNNNGGPLPLSVSTDRIGRAAMRAAGLLAALGVGIGIDDRTGAGQVVEVYPAAALRHWGCEPRKYKGSGNVAALKRMATDFFAAADWLSIDPQRMSTCMASDDAFDAVVAALNARAATRPEWVSTPVDDEDRLAALTEGWIAVPTCTLNDLDPRRRPKPQDG